MKNSASNNKTESSQCDKSVKGGLLDIQSLLILVLDSLGIEILNETEPFSLHAPIFVKCPYELALKISESPRFSMEMCGGDVFRVRIEELEHLYTQPTKLDTYGILHRKEPLTRKAESWLDMAIEYCYISIEGES